MNYVNKHEISLKLDTQVSQIHANGISHKLCQILALPCLLKLRISLMDK